MVRKGRLTTKLAAMSGRFALILLAVSLLAAPSAHALQVSISASRDTVPMGGSVAVDVRVSNDAGQPMQNVGVFSYIDDKRWGAHEMTDAVGQARLYLPLPNPGAARISVQAIEPASVPSWIWAPETSDNQTVALSTSFSLQELPRKAWLRLAVDDHCTVDLNGQAVGQAAGWNEKHIFEGLEQRLTPDANRLTVTATNGTGPAGLLAQLTLEYAGRTSVIDTDASWQCILERDEAGAPKEITPVTVIGGADRVSTWDTAIKDWPGIPTRDLLFAGYPLPEGAVVSNTVEVAVTPRSITVHEDPDHLIGIQWEPWFTPRNAYWQTAQAVPIVGFYDSFNRDVLRQHALWLMDAGVNFIYVDWSNHIWGAKHWSERGAGANEIIDATTFTLEAYADLRDEGLPVPKVVIMPGLTNGPPTTMEALNEELAWIRDTYLDNPRFEGLWVEYEGKPLVVPLDTAGMAVREGTPPVDDSRFTVRWMGTQLQKNDLEDRGYWSWMDGSLEPIVTYYNGKAEVVTPTPAYFADSGWLGSTARGRRGGTTFLESFKPVLRTRPKFVLFHQWNEFAGQLEGQGYGPNHDVYVDSYNVELSDDLEPVSLTAHAYRNDTGGWGFYYLNLLQALIRVFHQPEPQDTLLAVNPSGHNLVFAADTLDLEWSVIGKEPAGYTILLDGKLVAEGLKAMSYKVDLSGLPGPAKNPSDANVSEASSQEHIITVIAEGATTRFPLSYTEMDVIQTEPSQTKVEVRFRRHSPGTETSK